MQRQRVEIVGEGLVQRRAVETELELVRLKTGDGLVGKNQILTATEIEPDIGAILGHMTKHLVEGGETILIEPDRIVTAEIGDQVAAIALRYDERVGATAADQNVIAGATIDRLAAGGAGNDVVGFVAEGIATAARHGQILEIVGQGVAHPGVDGVDTTTDRLRHVVEA